MKSISIVIPNYNGADLLSKNLPSVYSALSTSGIKDFEIIVADDASTDNSILFLQEHYPGIHIVQNPENKGFSSNVNTGIRVAEKELVLVLNSDVLLTEGYFLPLLNYFDMPDTFGVSGRIISMTGEKIQDGAKYPKYRFAGIGSTTNYTCKTRHSLYSFFMSGANALVDRKKLLQFNGFNELFNPYYGEDTDLGLTAWRAGYKIYYEDHAVCRHAVSSTIHNQPPRKVKIIAKRNKFFLHYLHLEGTQLNFFLLTLPFKVFFKLFLLKTDYLRSYRLFLKSKKEIRDVKERFAKYRKKRVAEIVHFIRKDIVHDIVELF